MHLGRIRARVSSAKPVTKGFVTGHRLAFHKRGADGSGKADAAFTGDDNDRVWGVVYSLSEFDKPILDAYEFVGVGYDCKTVKVNLAEGAVDASIYVARSEAIDPSQKPYTWYLRFVLQGATEHNLPADYLQTLYHVETELDADQQRHFHNNEIATASKESAYRQKNS